MKKIALAAALTGAASFAQAGSLADPVVESPVEIIEEAAGSSSGVLVPLVLLAVILAAVAD